MKQTYPIHFKNTLRPCTTLRTLTLSLVLVGSGVEAFAATTYTFTDLTKVAVPGFPVLNLTATAINNKGLVLGGSLIYDPIGGTVAAPYPFNTASLFNSVGQVIGNTATSIRPPPNMSLLLATLMAH